MSEINEINIETDEVIQDLEYFEVIGAGDIARLIGATIDLSRETGKMSKTGHVALSFVMKFVEKLAKIDLPSLPPGDPEKIGIAEASDYIDRLFAAYEERRQYFLSLKSDADSMTQDLAHE